MQLRQTKNVVKVTQVFYSVVVAHTGIMFSTKENIVQIALVSLNFSEFFASYVTCKSAGKFLAKFLQHYKFITVPSLLLCEHVQEIFPAHV